MLNKIEEIKQRIMYKGGKGGGGGHSGPTREEIAEQARLEAERAKKEEFERAQANNIKYRKSIEKSFDELKNEALNETNLYLKSLEEQIDKINKTVLKDQKRAIQIKAIKNAKDDIEEKIEDLIKTALDNKISLSNYEYQEILKIEEENIRVSQMESYFENIYNDILKNTLKFLKKIINTQIENIHLCLSDELEIVNESYESKIEELENLTKENIDEEEIKKQKAELLGQQKILSKLIEIISQMERD